MKSRSQCELDVTIAAPGAAIMCCKVGYLPRCADLRGVDGVGCVAVKIEDGRRVRLKVKLSVKDGDVIDLSRQEKVNVFDAFKRSIELSDSDVSDASATAELHQAAAEFSEGFKHINRARSEVGTRLQTLDRQEDMHQDFKIVMSNARGTLEDLDYSTAVIELNENMMALQASQQAFAKTKDLNLFNYI